MMLMWYACMLHVLLCVRVCVCVLVCSDVHHDTLSIIQFYTFSYNNTTGLSSLPQSDTDQKGLQRAGMSRAETLQEKSAITVKNQKLYSILFTMNGVEELGKKAFILTCIVLIIAAAVGYYCSCVEQQEKLQTANKINVRI